jgi:small-conductance mechanosensitive channel
MWEIVIVNPEWPNQADFYSGALDRIRIFMIVLWAFLSLAAWFAFGRWTALGFCCGCAVAYLNFHWLKRAVAGLADRITENATRQKAGGIVLRFGLRYFLMAVAAYAILTISPASLYGLLSGLFLPVGAIACEAAYEAYAALFRGV